VLQQQLSEPAYYADMFARGIDPDLDDPTQCTTALSEAHVALSCNP
jgi:hypothetical protein